MAEDGARESSELQRRSDERRRSERIRAEVCERYVRALRRSERIRAEVCVRGGRRPSG